MGLIDQQQNMSMVKLKSYGALLKGGAAACVPSNAYGISSHVFHYKLLLI